ncbi:MAG: T9SS C-terminal target domain-containing protein [Bacteroidetes bacterium]|nr:MAG: T9SS C-terminal target domain-containing protein [Bacteroidota bacterium]
MLLTPTFIQLTMYQRMFACLLFFCLWGAVLPAQPSYFWTAEGKQEVTEDRSALVLHFAEPVRVGEVLIPTARTEMPLASASEMRQAVQLSMDEAGAGEAGAVARAYLQAAAPLRSAAFALRMPDGMQLWPTHRIVLQPNEAFDEQRFRAMLTPYPGYVFSDMPTGGSLLEIDDLSAILPLANALYESGMFAWCQPDFMVDVRPQSGQEIQVGCPPSDPLYSAPLFYLDNPGGGVKSAYPYRSMTAGIDINAPEAWCLSLGSASITVAVIDEGVEAHEDLENDATNQSRVLPGYSTADPVNGVGAPVASEDAHGQAIAGVIAASHNSVGVSGVAPNVHILPVQIPTDGTATVSQIATAINWAWQNGADIINNSWVLNSCVSSLFPPIEQAITQARTLGRGGLGCLVVFSSGSQFTPNCVGYPATLPEVLAVGAVDGQGNAPSYASQGPELDLVGVSSYDGIDNVTVMDRMGVLGYNDGSGVVSPQYSNPNYTMWFGGTSVTAAQAAGVAALMLSVNSGLTEASLRSILTSTATDMGPAGFDNAFGHGRIDAFAAVSAAQTTFPVEWLAFDAKVWGEEIVLDWTTASELNNDRFIVERQGPQGFVAIGEVAGAGTTQAPQDYRFFDAQPLPGRNTYRLQQVDLDGRSSYSSTVEVVFPVEGISLLYPNPASASTQFSVYARRGGRLSWTLLDLQGRQLQTSTQVLATAEETVTVPLEGLARGYYLLRIATSEGDQTYQRLEVR